MNKNLYKSKSIKTVLGEHASEIFSLMDEDKEQAYDKVMELLNSTELKNNPDIVEAKTILADCYKHNYNYYLSTLTTYLTGIKVS